MAVLKIILPVVLLSAGAAAGVGVGLTLRPAEEATVDEPPAEEEWVAPTASETNEFAPMNNQFVVPVVRSGNVRAMVILSITLEMKPGTSSIVFTQEPRLRDAFLQVLFDHANLGGFDEAFTLAERMSVLRQGLREVALRILGRDVRDVLIVDIVRQEV